MVSPPKELIYNIKLSSVGPGKVSGQDLPYEPSNMDLAMKLHYLKGVYYFQSEAFQGLNIMNIKEPSFSFLNVYYMSCGRFRRDDTGRPFIKCNDCGVRFIEGECDKTLNEWLEVKDEDSSLEKLLVADKIIGPELQFSPIIYMQLTKFKCGGVALGLSWSHVLGDVFSATDYMNVFAQFMAGNKKPPLPLNNHSSNSKPSQNSEKISENNPLSVKKVGPVEDHWITPTNSKMESFAFHVKLGSFETICALIWKSIAKIREGNEPKIVTVCKKNSLKHTERLVANTQSISVVHADISVSEADPTKLAELIGSAVVDEQGKIEEAMEKELGLSDFIVYGANLTFANFEGAELYDFELQGIKPISVSYTIDGVGDEGAVLVLPGSKSGDQGRIVTVILPENEVIGMKIELKKNGLFS